MTLTMAMVMLFELNHILVCTDLSPNSDEVLRSAEKIRHRTNSQLDILYVSDLGLNLEWSTLEIKKETYYDKFISGMKNEILQKLHQQLQRTGLKGRVVFLEGNVVQKIRDQISHQGVKYDLLVLGHSGTNLEVGLLHHYLGSVCRRIVANVEIPTIVIKKPIEFNKMMSFVDGSKPLDWMVAFSFDFYRLLKFHKIEFVTLFTSIGRGKSLQNSIVDFKEQLCEDVKYLSREDDLFEVQVQLTHEVMLAHHFARLVEDHDIDLAILKRNQGKKLNKKFIGSETLRLLELQTCSLLILPVS
jgi:nucleotide-binding universal stress UspA family protein